MEILEWLLALFIVYWNGNICYYFEKKIIFLCTIQMCHEHVYNYLLRREPVGNFKRSQSLEILHINLKKHWEPVQNAKNSHIFLLGGLLILSKNFNNV